ncbi:MAG: BLUF domain-containing protein [Halothiobacillaceae bacterium]
MYLVRLIYASRAVEGFGIGDIHEILEVSRVKNARAGLTGVLCFDSCSFLQCLEGSRDEVNTIYHRILNDDRHTSPLLLEYGETHQRHFQDWEMAYVGLVRENQRKLLKFNLRGDFDPFAMSGQSAFAFLCSIVEPQA